MLRWRESRRLHVETYYSAYYLNSLEVSLFHTIVRNSKYGMLHQEVVSIWRCRLTCIGVPIRKVSRPSYFIMELVGMIIYWNRPLSEYCVNCENSSTFDLYGYDVQYGYLVFYHVYTFWNPRLIHNSQNIEQSEMEIVSIPIHFQWCQCIHQLHMISIRQTIH